jgi:hypothetical protein
MQIIYLLFNIKIKFIKKNSNGDWGWGLGIGDWGFGIGDWAQSPIPNPQSPLIKTILNNLKINKYFHNSKF